MKRPLSIRPHSAAVLCIDLQEEHRQDSRYLVGGFDLILANVKALQTSARRLGLPVCHCAYVNDLDAYARPFHPVLADGTSAFSDKSDPLTAICPEVAPVGSESLIIKGEASVFRRSSPAAALRERGIEWLLVCGVWTEACVDATVKDAIELGFRVILVKDACGSGTEAMHQTAILNLANRLYGGAVVTTDQACRLMAGESLEAWQVAGSVPLRYDFATAADLYAAL